MKSHQDSRAVAFATTTRAPKNRNAGAKSNSRGYRRQQKMTTFAVTNVIEYLK